MDLLGEDVEPLGRVSSCWCVGLSCSLLSVFGWVRVKGSSGCRVHVCTITNCYYICKNSLSKSLHVYKDEIRLIEKRKVFGQNLVLKFATFISPSPVSNSGREWPVYKMIRFRLRN